PMQTWTSAMLTASTLPAARLYRRRSSVHGNISQTAMAMRAIQLYAPKPVQSSADKAVRLAAAWLATAKASNNEDGAWRLMGLAWAGLDKVATRTAMKELVAAQRPDGGWSDLPSMQSTA